jgi:triacylglycerol esterase/lipase EstA (alpha/beta hydrolase family)
MRRLALTLALAVGSLMVTHAASAHPGHGAPTRPLLLVGGTFGPASYMDDVRASFVAQGFDVTTMQLEGSPPGSADIRTSAQAVCNQIDSIRARTGAATVDVVGHSQGALAVRYCVKSLGGASEVSTMVSLGGPNYGTSRAYLCASTACRQMRPGSSFLTELNAGDDTPGSVRYVHLFSYEASGGLPGEDVPLADGATNVAAQDRCPGRQVEHRDEYDVGIMRDLIRDAVLQEPLTTTCP